VKRERVVVKSQWEQASPATQQLFLSFFSHQDTESAPGKESDSSAQRSSLPVVYKALFVVSALMFPERAALVHAASVLAQSQSQAPQTVRNRVFVNPEQLSAASILEPPPSAKSRKTLVELAMLHHIQETRTASQIRRANEDEREESIFAFASVIGPQFNRATLPLTTLLSDDVRSNERIIVNSAKRFFRRPRPYHLDPTIRPVCRTTKNQQDYSYPSGHGTTGYLEGLVLAEMVPERREKILSRADDYAYSREVCGVHYPSDEVASRTVANAMFNIMINNPLFRAELAAATVELRAKVGLGSISRNRSSSERP
jgi:acid phosphatase (class A)